MKTTVLTENAYSVTVVAYSGANQDSQTQDMKVRENNYYDGCFDSKIGLPVANWDDDDYIAGYFSQKHDATF